MRLLIVIPNIVSYRTFLTELCEALIADGTEVHIACSDSGTWGNDPAAQQRNAVQFHRIDAARGMNPLQHLRAARQLRQIVRAIQPDLIHAHFSAAIFTTALARRSSWPATIATFHGVSFLSRNGRSSALVRLGEVFSARRFDAAWVLTQDDAAGLRAAARGLKVATIPSHGLGCDLARFSPAGDDERAASRAALRLDARDCVFVFMGRFAQFKGFDLAVRAFLKHAAEHSHARLLLVGSRDPLHPTGLSAEEEHTLRASAQIIDAGYQKDVRRYLAAADAMVFPSTREGMAVCLMEALAMGIPAITRDARGCREVVRDGIDGLVLPECDAEHLSRAMRRLSDDPALRAQLSARAVEGRERFSRAHFIAAQKSIYAACAKVRGAVKVAHVTTVVSSLHGLLLNQMGSLADAGYDICGISSPGEEVSALAAAGLAHIAVPISRNLSPLKDVASLWSLWRVMRREAFTIVHTHTPKAGLLGQLAARLAGVPVVVNTVHGFYFHERMRPLARRFYITFEKIAAHCSDIILSQNREDVETAVREHICPREKIRHLGNGIDLEQFAPGRVSAEELARLRAECGLREGTPVVGFVGRLAGRRKGFFDFLKAAQQVSAALPAARFLIVGSADSGKPDAVQSSIAADYGIADRCLFAGQRGNVELPAFYSMMSVLVLPSLFEGVPRVVMEASAMGVPSVVSDVKGNREAVVHETTGLLVPLGDVAALSAAILQMLNDPEQAAQMGRAGRRLAAERFDERVVFARIKSEYAALLKTQPSPLPAPLCV